MYEFLSYEVRDVMAPRPRTLTESSTVGDAQDLIETYGFNMLPVVDSFARLKGIVTQFDVLRAFAFSEAPVVPEYDKIMALSVGAFMNRDPKTVTATEPLTKVLQLMIDTERKSFPVVEGEVLVGIITRQDVAYALRLAAGGQTPERGEETA